MASTVRRPSPGMANTLSVTTAPPIKSAMPMPITVTIGTEAFFSAWMNRIGLCPKPLAREEEGEQVADHEHRDREAEHREAHDRAVDPGADLPGGEHADRHRDRDR